MGTIIHDKKTLLRIEAIRLDRETVTLDNGLETVIHVLRHPGAAAIVPFLDENTVVLVRQYRHALGDYIWEIPAGTIDVVDESPLACARRELLEETGYQGGDFQKLGVLAPAPGYSDECLHLFRADNLIPGRQVLEADEMIEIKPMDFQTALRLVYTNEIWDAKTMTGLMLADQQRRLADPARPEAE